MQSNYNSNNVIIIQTTLKKESEIEIGKKKQILFYNLYCTSFFKYCIITQN